METITAKLTLQGDNLKIVWSYKGLDFPAYCIDKSDVKKSADKIRSCLGKLVARGMEQEDGRRLRTSGDLLRDLAGLGWELYNVIFDAVEGDAERVKRWLEGLNDKCRVMFSVDRRVHIPWGMIFDSDPSLLSGLVEDVEVASYGSFWCLKYSLTTVYSRIPPTTLGNATEPVRFRLLPVWSAGCLEKAQPWLAPDETSNISWLRTCSELPAIASADLFERWRIIGDKIGLLFFYCHGGPDCLSIGQGDVITITEFKYRLRREEAAHDRPACLTFLNGCTTAVGNPDGGFLEATGGAGYCGFIGTETEVPDVFALRFSLAFLFLFLQEKKTLLEAMDRLRRTHFPLSILYSVYGHPDVCGEPDILFQSVPKPPSDENFSFGRLGSSTL